MTLEPDGTLADAAIDRDVAWTIVRGSGTLVLAAPPDDASRQQLKLEPEMLVVLPAGSRRELVAGASGMTWSSVHRRRAPLEL
ncbi:MAG: hypothetical protein KDC46_07620 [Thermoleophilia bacterium]|nr:hypothetical protein [Thermoleophilia bacterium]